MPKKKRGAGRPKSGFEVRDAEVGFNLTRDDADWYNELAHDLGFRSRAEFFTAIMERLRLGGFAPAACLKLGWQIKKRADEVGLSRGAGMFNPFESWPRLPVGPGQNPPLALPDEEMPLKEIKKHLVNLDKQLSPT